MFQSGGFDISDSVVLNSWLGLVGGGSVVVCDLKDEVDVTNSCDGDSDGRSIISSEFESMSPCGCLFLVGIVSIVVGGVSYLDRGKVKMVVYQ